MDSQVLVMKSVIILRMKALINNKFDLYLKYYSISSCRSSSKLEICLTKSRCQAYLQTRTRKTRLLKNKVCENLAN